MNKWYEKSGEHSDIVISTRIRLARNISKYPFPCKLNDNMKIEVSNDIKNALMNGDFKEYNFQYLNLEDVNEIDCGSLVECHLLSPDFIKQSGLKTVFLSSDENISIMANEEDHIRLQVMKEGLDLNSTYNIADGIDSKLDNILKFAFNDQLGYLTQCPTNLGTGMRASIMLHLPALGKFGLIDNIASNLIKLGLTIRGIYGEGTEPKGDIYQISNQVTLGISEKTALKNLNDITLQIINQEKDCRDKLASDIQIIDTISRSLGILKTARILSCNEFMKLISNIRLGLSVGTIKGISYDIINEMTVTAQPYMIMKSENSVLDSYQRDVKRAIIISEKIQNAELI